MSPPPSYLKSPIITIHVGEEPTTLSAHMALLQASPFLARACATYTAETPLNERSIQLPDEDLAAVGSLLEYLYTGEYFPRLIRNGDTTVLEDLPESEASDLDDSGEHLLRHARIYTLGEKLELPKLKELAHSKIHRINSTAKGELRYARFVYKNTSREDKVIRAPIASFWAHRSHVLRHEAEDEFCRMILEFPMFAYDILSIVLDAKEKSKEKRGTGIGPSDEQPLPDTPSQKVPRTGRKRPRNSTTL
ncbi:hypothetical protein EDC01DRAFT_249582 [Geopyxis carbonaria]|nr:hypothetical protein EDC01DRAFT_249582 [Geopyxis carbonaria]